METHRSTTPKALDEDEDTFQDAQDTTPRPRSKERTRSLTDRASSPSDALKAARSGLRPTKRNPLPPRRESIEQSHQPVQPVESAQPVHTTPPVEDDSLASKSPDLTSEEISLASMDDVSLEEGKDDNWPLGSSTLTNLASSKPLAKEVSNNGVQQAITEPAQAPPAAQRPQSSSPTPPAPSRKLNSPFSWFSRNTSSVDKKMNSPPLPSNSQKDERRGTMSSIATLGSNPELSLAKIEDATESGDLGQSKGGRNSLKDRFKYLRMREEAGITDDENMDPNGVANGGAIAGLIGRSASIGFGVGSPTSLDGEKDEDQIAVAVRANSVPGPGTLTRKPTVNPNLAPGTAAGVATGPYDNAAPIDWDLWQSVVNDGPAAVLLSSPENLTRAIASGIPQAIRGVIWQILAQSKNAELEASYWELKDRGTEKERSSHPPPMNRTESNGHINGTAKEKGSIASSSSSVHSDQSTPATTASITNGATSPPISHDGNSADAMAKSQADFVAAQQKKSKDDAVAIAKLEKMIRRDMGSRTSYSKYLMSAGLQDGLFGVCKAYALYDEAVGYAQGINFIAMPLLFNMPEEEAFCLLVRLMNKYGVRDLFIQDMPGLHLHLYQFERLLEDFEPALYCHLHRRGVSPQLYATQWFLTLFAYRFPLQLVLRIYDLILSEGLEGAILKFGLVLMQKNAQTLLEMKDMAKLTTFLKERLFDVYIDRAPSANSLLESGFFGSAGGIDKEVYRADMLVQDACAIKISSETLSAYAEEWREKQRMEKERESEMENLRLQATGLAQKVRRLEERTQTSDVEHVQMASELVRTKVENENLSDENESLRGQVDELKRIVEVQKEEVEAKLREEMDAVMAKNAQVHNENRALEEQMQDMEKVLVETKMQFAQLNSEYETIKQRWANVQAMLNTK